MKASALSQSDGGALFGFGGRGLGLGIHGRAPHLILVPSDAGGSRRALAAVHRRYAAYIRARPKRSGHFWQGHFGCVAMDEAHLAAALRYVALNPVRAGLATRAVDWPWSSVHAHLGRLGDGVTTIGPVLDRQPDFAALTAAGEESEAFARLRKAETIGRPVGDAAFLAALERESGRTLAAAKRGRKTAKSALSP